ncbi:unnamed protein product [Meloidogyne enterolobii]|uniref:Uncharacterized protein n=1 Tax=Meloidogyne enterolobii TaxID=390850 RepID=A0ACB1AZ15_MELEN
MEIIFWKKKNYGRGYLKDIKNPRAEELLQKKERKGKGETCRFPTGLIIIITPTGWERKKLILIMNSSRRIFLFNLCLFKHLLLTLPFFFRILPSFFFFRIRLS